MTSITMKRALSPEKTSTPKKKKYAAKFNSKWIQSLQWVSRSDKGENYAYCKICNSHFSVAAGGKNDCDRHAQGTTHIKFSKTVSQSKPMSTLFLNAKNQELCSKVSKAEVLFSNFVAEHNLPFAVGDHFTKLAKEMFPDSEIAAKFSSGRMKTTRIVKDAIAPELELTVISLCKTSKFSLMIDESNNKGCDKDLVILVRLFDKELGRAVTRFVDMPVCNDGTAEGIFAAVNKVFEQKNIPWSNVMAFASDNCSVMKGKHNSVLSRVKEVQPTVLDIGCICHLANLCCVNAIKKIPLPVEDLLVDIYFHFHHSSKRKEAFKEFEEFTDTEPMKILKHCSTRWLSLSRCVRRTLLQWPALQSYFSSHEESEKPGRVKRCADGLSNPEMKLYFQFLEFIMVPMTEFNTLFQSEETQIGVLVPECKRLLRKFMAKFVTMQLIKPNADDLTKIDFKDTTKQLSNDYIAIGAKAKTMLVDEQDSISATMERRFYDSVRQYYVATVDKMLKIFPFKNSTLKDLSILNPDPKLREKQDPNAITRLAETFCVVPESSMDALAEEFTDYQLCEESELPKFELLKTRTDEFWGSVSRTTTSTGSLRFPLLGKTMCTLSAIAHSNADSERVFSMCRKINTDQRGNLNNDTVCSLLACKINRDEECHEFKPSAELLKKSKTVTWDYVRDHQ